MTVHKLTIKDTIEDGMLVLQQKKRDFAQIILDGAQREKAGWMHDMRTLLMHMHGPHGQADPPLL